MQVFSPSNQVYDVAILTEAVPIARATPPRGKNIPGFMCRVETKGAMQMSMQFPPELVGQITSDVWAKFISEFNMLQNARQQTQPGFVESCGVCLFCCLCPCCGGCAKYEEFNQKQLANEDSFRNQLSVCVTRWNEQTFRNHNLVCHLGFEERHWKKVTRGQTGPDGQRGPDQTSTWSEEVVLMDVAQINPVAKVVMSPMSVMMPSMSVNLNPPNIMVSGMGMNMSIGTPVMNVKVSGNMTGMPTGFPLCLRNAHNQQLSYTGQGFTSSPNEASWETWVLEEAGPGHVFISNPTHNMRISASDDRKSVNASPNRSTWERFAVRFPNPGQIVFTSAHGTQLSQTDRGILMQSPNVAAWETFTVIPKGSPGVLQPPGMLM